MENEKIYKAHKSVLNTLGLIFGIIIFLLAIIPWIILPIYWSQNGFNPWMLAILILPFGQYIFLWQIISVLKYKVITKPDSISGNKIGFNIFRISHETVNFYDVKSATIRQNPFHNGHIEILFNMSNDLTKKINISYSHYSQQRELYDFLKSKIEISVCDKMPIQLKQTFN